MKVYVMEDGEYEQRGIAGIFDTLERAMGSRPGKWTRTVWQSRPHWYEEWSLEGSSAQIRAYEVEANGPLAEPLATATVQRFEAPPPGDSVIRGGITSRCQRRRQTRSSPVRTTPVTSTLLAHGPRQWPHPMKGTSDG